MKYRLLFSMLFFAMSGILSAQESNNAEKQSNNPLLSSDKPIGLVADKGYYDQQTGLAVYEGNVVVTQKDIVIWSDKLTILLTNGAAQHIEAEGNPVKFEYKGQKKLIKGHAKRVDYEVSNKQVTLTGNAMVMQGSDKILGDKLTYNLENERIGGSRIKMTFSPTK